MFLNHPQFDNPQEPSEVLYVYSPDPYYLTDFLGPLLRIPDFDFFGRP